MPSLARQLGGLLDGERSDTLYLAGHDGPLTLCRALLRRCLAGAGGDSSGTKLTAGIERWRTVPEVTFQTKRLSAGEWHEVDPEGRLDLPAVMAEMLTEPVTRWLPPDWQGRYTRARAEAWIAERDAEGPVLLVVHRETTQPLGLILLFEEAMGDGVEVRVGYLLAEPAWGQGYGGELLDGLVTWSRVRSDVRSVIGGVAPDNTASIRLLERHGFVLDGEAAPDGDLTYRLAIDR